MNTAERLVVRALNDSLPPEAIVLPNVRITHEAEECEIDALVLWPGVGTAVVEIKGGQISLDRGRWMQADRDGAHEIANPVAQAQRSKHILIDYFRPRLPSFNGIGKAVHLAVLPYSTLPVGFEAPDAPPELVVDSTGLDELAGRIVNALRRQGGDYLPLPRQALRIAVENLQKSAKAIDNQQNLARELEDTGNLLTAEQDRVLDLLRLQRRVQISGGAGSGKTHLAMMKARRLAREGVRTALLCYSRGLAHHFQLQARAWPADERPAYIGLFHRLAHWWGSTSVEPPTREEASVFFEQDLPRELTGIAAALPVEERFGAVVVDEAQDFSDIWWDALVACMSDPEDGVLWAFTDHQQRIFDRDGAAPIELSPFILDDNLRNTPQIARTFASLTPYPQRVRLGDGVPVRFVDVDPVDVLGRADDAVLALGEEGWSDGDIALITAGSRHPVQVEQVEMHGWDAYWDSYFAGDDVFYGHVRGFKGLERSCVVLAFNAHSEWSHAQETLYVGLSRARSLLVVVGPREEIEAAGGPEVMRALDDGDAWCPPFG
ncbi:MAG TPA: NERD domain-containing protein [Actinomycetaceae bacterium]|nr:NERD domain-containing protein [Actinomycetaceae bacterium]